MEHGPWYMVNAQEVLPGEGGRSRQAAGRSGQGAGTHSCTGVQETLCARPEREAGVRGTSV